MIYTDDNANSSQYYANSSHYCYELPAMTSLHSIPKTSQTNPNEVDYQTYDTSTNTPSNASQRDDSLKIRQLLEVLTNHAFYPTEVCVDRWEFGCYYSECNREYEVYKQSTVDKTNESGNEKDLADAGDDGGCDQLKKKLEEEYKLKLEEERNLLESKFESRMNSHMAKMQEILNQKCQLFHDEIDELRKEISDPSIVKSSESQMSVTVNIVLVITDQAVAVVRRRRSKSKYSMTKQR